ncbi:MAG: ABC transporter ATP-binding protein [Oscillospiraceae bacterium]|nr:ABC transporter ATP-binding protein [Oscillospiraceae bacterium]
MKKTKEKPVVHQMMHADTASVESNNKRQAWKPLFHFIRQVKMPWILIAVCVVLNLAQGYLTLLFPSYTEQIYAGNFSKALAITATVIVLGKALLTAAIQGVCTITANITQMRFQEHIWRRLSRLPLSFYDKNEPRDLISRTTEDTTTLSEFFSHGISSLLSTIYTLIGSFVLILAYDWRLAASMLITIPLIYAIAIISGRFYFKMNNQVQAKLSNMTRYFASVLPYITLTKFFGQENREEQNGLDWIAKHFKTSFDNAKIGLVLTFAQTVVQVIFQLVIILMGVWLVRDGSIDIGIWIAFYMYANTLYSSFSSLSSQWQSLKRNQGCAARITQVTDTPIEENNGTMDASGVEGDLAFRNVTFAYGEQNVLNDVSFTVPSGKVTAVVGPSGAGKSTILNLVERFYTPNEGSVALNGQDIKEYELRSWRRNIGYIPQNCQLFSGTIRDNIAYAVPGQVSDEAVTEAARLADALEFIQSFEKGFDTEVGENGAKLSGGQRQRIAIARALLMDSKLLILDEATSNLDAESEAAIEATLKKVSQRCTVLMVAHRMDTVRDADRIVVMENTRVNAVGTHEELAASCELYRKMIGQQAVDATV